MTRTFGRMWSLATRVNLLRNYILAFGDMMGLSLLLILQLVGATTLILMMQFSPHMIMRRTGTGQIMKLLHLAVWSSISSALGEGLSYALLEEHRRISSTV